MPCTLCRLTALVVLLALAVASDPSSAFADPKAEAALKPLLDRFNESAGDRAALARDVITFRRGNAGTPEAVKAAELLSKLPSPLDQLDASKIKSIEKFDWQPKELVAVMGEHLGRHGAPVTCVAFSPDGKMSASGGAHYVRVWNPVTMRLHALLGGHITTCVAFSRDSKTLAAGSGAGTVYVYDVTDPDKARAKFNIAASSGGVPAIAFGPDGKLAIACGDNALRIFEVGDAMPKEVATKEVHAKGLSSVAWSPDGKAILTGSYDLSIKSWVLEDGNLNETSQFAGLTQTPTVLHFNPAGTNLAVASADGFIRIYPTPLHAKSKERSAMLFKDVGAATSLSFSNTGQTLASGHADGIARLWTVTGASFVKRSELKGHSGSVTGVAYAPDNKTMITGSADWTARSWDLMKTPPDQRQIPRSHLSHVYAVAWAPDGLTLATGSEDTVLRLWDMALPEPQTRPGGNGFLKGDSVPIYCVTFSPDGKYVAAGGKHANVRQWDAAKGTVLRPCAGHTNHVYNVAYSPDGKQLMTATQKEVTVFESSSAKQMTRITNNDSRFHQTAFSPDGKSALTCSGERLYVDGKPAVDKKMQPVFTECFIKYWNLTNGSEIFCEKSFTVPVYSVSFSTDGKQAYAGVYSDARGHRYDVAADKLTEVNGIPGKSGYLWSMTVAPDGQTGISRGLDGAISWWDLTKGVQLKTWGFAENVGNVAFAPDGRHLAVSLGTGVVYILRLEK